VQDRGAAEGGDVWKMKDAVELGVLDANADALGRH
jgi:hypothetical protein